MDPHASQIFDSLDRNGTIGMGYLGVVVSSLIYGFTCIQTFHYYRSPKGLGDPVYIRAFVLGVWILDTTHQCLVIYAFYHYLVKGYGIPTTLFYLSWSIPASLVVNDTIFVLIRCFFLMRIWTLSHNKLLVVGLGLLAIARFGFALYYSSLTFMHHVLLEAETYTKEPIWSLSLEVATTISYTGTFIFYLHRGRSGFERSDNMVTRILTMVISSSALSAVIAIATLCAYTLAPTKLYNLFFEFVLETIDVNAVLTSLNSRDFLHQTGAKHSAFNVNRRISTAPPQGGKESERPNVSL